MKSFFFLCLEYIHKANKEEPDHLVLFCLAVANLWYIYLNASVEHKDFVRP